MRWTRNANNRTDSAGGISRDSAFVAPEAPRQYVTSANNEASPATILAVALFVLLGSIVILSWSISRLTGWPLAAMAVAGTIIYVALSYVVLLIVNGDWLAWREIVRSTANQRYAMTRHANLLDAQELHRHTEAMARIQLEVDASQTGQHIRQLQAEVNSLSHRLLSPAQPAAVPITSSYVSAADDTTRQTALGWVATLYKEGRPDSAKVTDTGRLRQRAPWSKRGAWSPVQSTECYNYLQHHNVISAIPGGYRLNVDRFPTLSHLGRL